MLEKYEKYLANIGESIDKFFAEQEPYIFCKKGCSLCCETGEYPFSELEFKYAMVGYNALNEKEKEIVKKKVNHIKIDKNNKKDSDKKKFMHECPFLIDKKCCIYNYRGIICRNHGLLYYTVDKDGKTVYSVPHCVNDGLNYNNVFDEQAGTISSLKWKETGINMEPVSYNIGYKFLTNNETTNLLGLNFGEEKALIDWF